jgi:acetyltransferase-like isoleucine patch superfamily enzyme
MMWQKLKMLKYPVVNGLLLPFNIHINAGIKIRKTATVKLNGRVVIGNSNPQSAIVSLQKANIYVGNKASICFGKSISIGPGVNLIVKDHARLTIGNNTYFTSDMHVEAVNEITIGDDCAISWGVTIIDSDHHAIIYEKKRSVSGQEQVRIGNKVWIGCNVTILKNTVIGNNCVVAANSLVTGVFPDNCLIGGNPARIIKQEVSWK